MRSVLATSCRNFAWLDHLAIGIAAVCAVHCLFTPILIITLPLIATSFFVDDNFHLWMLLLVLPTTSFAIFMGCRKHRDKTVAVLSAIGLSVLVIALLYERSNRELTLADQAAEAAHLATCDSCSRDVLEEPLPTNAAAWINTFGGLLLAGGHIRNFRLCRRQKCNHDH